MTSIGKNKVYLFILYWDFTHKTFSYNAAKIVSDYLQTLAQNEYVIKDTLLFAKIIKNDILDPEEEYVSYDVESLFTSIPISETSGYIIKEIYENKVVKQMCKSKLIFRRLWEKLTKNCVFSVIDELVKQIEGCPMGGAISVIMSGIHMKSMEKDCVAPLNPKFYRRYVDNTVTKRKENAGNDELFPNMNSHHKNMKLTIESNPTRFLDTAFNVNPDGSVTTKVFQKPEKFSAFWSSQIRKLYKRNNINDDLHRAFKIFSDFDAEVSIIIKKYLEAGYPIGFIKSVISDFKKKDENQQIIPDWLFEERSKILFKLPKCPPKEYEFKKFIEKIETFTGGKIMLIDLWSTRNTKSLFPFKDKVCIDLA